MPTKTLSLRNRSRAFVLVLLILAFGIPAFAQRDEVDVMLVLDKSGSMSQNVPGLSMNKWEVLQQSVQAFLEAYRLWGEDADRIGVTYFDHTRGDFPPGGLVPFNAPMNPLPLTGPGSIQADMAGRSPGGMTCLGGGILAGYLSFDATHVNRNMIIFTDGMQNMEPTVSQAIGTDMVINDYNVRPDGTGFPSPPLDLKDPSLDFRTYTIGIGDNTLTGLLQDIAGAPVNTAFDGTPEFLNSMINLNLELDRIFSQTFVEGLADFSPQLVDIRRVTGGSSQRFTVNKSANKLLIRIASDPASLRRARIRVLKGERDFSDRLTANLTYRTFYIDSAAMRQYYDAIEGSWTVRIDAPGDTYQITCIVNDETMDVDARVTSAALAPGDTLHLEALLAYEEQPIADATGVKVLVAKPGMDTNDLFAQAAAPDVSPGFPTEDASDPGQQKYEALIALDSAFVAALTPQTDTVNLSYAGDRYAGVFTDTEESGIYRFVFRMSGDNSETGPYERFVMRSVVLDFGEPDVTQSPFTVIGDGKDRFFRIQPRNRFGHLLGPNRLSQVHITVNGDPVKLTDRLDGTYDAPVPDFPFFNPDPRVTVDIKGSTFYDDDFSGIEGSNLTFWEKYRVWIILLLIIAAIIVFLLRKL